MATYDWPEALEAASFEWGVQKAGLQFKGPYNGTTQALDFVAERWVVGVTLPPRKMVQAGAVEAFFNRMAGGVHRLRLWHMASGTRQERGAPRGSLRGSPQVSGAHVRGDSALRITGGAGRNLVTGGSFEVDTSGDGVANGWGGYANGDTGALTRTLEADSPQHGSKYQKITAAALGATSVDRAGVSQSVLLAAATQAPMVASCYVRMSAAVTARVLLRLYSGGVEQETRTLTQGDFSAGNDWLRMVLPFTPSVPIDEVQVLVFMQQGTGGGPYSLNVDAVQLEYGAAASDYEPRGGSLMAGDMLGVAGGQLLQVAENVFADDSAALDVPLVTRLRANVASGSAVTWNRPTAEFVLPAMQMRHLFTPGGALQGGQFDLEEVW